MNHVLRCLTAGLVMPNRWGGMGAHISCRLDDGSGGSLNAIAFQAGGTPLGDALLAGASGTPLHILGRVRRDHFRGGRAMQLEIEDAAPVRKRSGAGL